MIIDIFMDVDPLHRNFESFNKFNIEDVNKFAISFSGMFSSIAQYQKEMKEQKPENLVSDERVILKYNVKDAKNVRLEISVDKFNVNSCVLVQDRMGTVGDYATLLKGTESWRSVMKKTLKNTYEQSLKDYEVESLRKL